MTLSAAPPVVAVRPWCPTCRNPHAAVTSPCETPGECPDCLAPHGTSCLANCLSRTEVMYESSDEGEVKR